MKSDTITLELDKEKVVSIIKQLPLDDKIRIFKVLEKETWARRLDEVVSRIRKRFKQNPISNKEIIRICEVTRQRLYNERTKSRN